MNKERCLACHTPHDTAKEPHHFQESRPFAWICDWCWNGSLANRNEYTVSDEGGIDLVNEPPHYKGLVVRVPWERVSKKKSDTGLLGGAYREVEVESIELIEGFGFGFNLGNVVKYLYRSNEKGDRLENLRKCRWYLDREIEHG